MIRPLFVGSVILIDINLKIAEGVARCVRCVYVACENIAAVFGRHVGEIMWFIKVVGNLNKTACGVRGGGQGEADRDLG